MMLVLSCIVVCCVVSHLFDTLFLFQSEMLREYNRSSVF